MDIGIVMNTMRDPAGVPAHPALFQALMVLTWIFHIAFVHLTLGASGLAIYAFHRRSAHPHWAKLTVAMTKVAKVGVSLLIVLGVAPLLFTQVIYDPQWYASNVLSGAWAIGFIFSLMLAYCLWFAFYYANKPGAGRNIGWYAWVALILFCMDGLIMHALSYQAILPGEWMTWYAPAGQVNTSGTSIHAIDWARYLFIMGLSVPGVGVFLLAYARYFAVREDQGRDYLNFTAKLGTRLAKWGYGLGVVLMLIWQLSQPFSTGLQWHPVGWALFLMLAGMTVWMNRLSPNTHGYLPTVLALTVLAALSLWREVIRVTYLAPYGYDIHDYTVHTDWPSALLFFSTLLGVGGLVGGYYLTLLYRAGRVQGLYTADRTVSRLGVGAVAVLALWIAVFFAYGIAIWVRNTFV